MDYKQAGVDVEAGYEAVSLMKEHVKKTLNERVLGGLGSFGGFYDLSGMAYKEPVLVAGTDGVGTKLKYAFALDKHDTVGIDCVAMCVNDIICQGAKPLFFLDYIATGKLVPEKVAQIVKGVAEGCTLSGCALIGGETAEMPGFYTRDEYDMAGFAVGIVDKKKSINGAKVTPGDILIGLPSSGLHSNGFSLVRKLLPPEMAHTYEPRLGCTYGEELLKPTKLYVSLIAALLQKFDIHGIANITGGGFIENIPRIFPEGIGGKVQLGSWPIPPIFSILQELSGLGEDKLYNTWNMGIGMVLAVAPSDADAILDMMATQLHEKAYPIGSVVCGKPGIELCH